MRWVALLLVTVVAASQGDRAPAYVRCVAEREKRCAEWAPSAALRLTRWTCADDSRYACAQELTDATLAAQDGAAFGEGGALEGLAAGEMVQFNGKWPFRRWLGMQEPFSVLFSLLNLAAHLRGFRSLATAAPKTPAQARLRRYYRLNAVVGIVCWLFSALFHTRDTSQTEKGDYFSAAFAIGYGLWLAIVRCTGLYRHATSPLRQCFAALGLLAFLAHCLYLSRGRFDYGYNMQANLGVGVTQMLVWALWTCVAPETRSLSTTPAQKPVRPLLPLLLILLSTGFEVFDFAPVPHGLRWVDAHALWHASTVGIVLLWYQFLRDDVVRA